MKHLVGNMDPACTKKVLDTVGAIRPTPGTNRVINDTLCDSHTSHSCNYSFCQLSYAVPCSTVGSTYRRL